jgi:hypothetical protein
VGEKLLWPDHNFAARRTALVRLDAKVCERFSRFLRDDLWLDQYIRQGRYRLEYLVFQHGAPQYRIYRGKVVWYVADAKPKSLQQIQREVAQYAMSVYGFGVLRSDPQLTRIDPLARKYPKNGSWCENQAS